MKIIKRVPVGCGDIVYYLVEHGDITYCLKKVTPQGALFILDYTGLSDKEKEEIIALVDKHEIQVKESS